MTTDSLADGTLTDGGLQADGPFVFTDDMYDGGVGAPGLPGYNEMGKSPLREGELTYRGMNILAPMVRVNTLAFRLLALDCGADMVYSEEVIDHRFIQCKRVVNTAVNSVDFVEPGTGIVVFRTCAAERTRVAFQMGTADAVRALKAAELVCNDVAAIDINMGCPKPFSTSGGMGSALLSRPETACDILSTLRRNLPASIAVTCKIRLLDSPHRTLDFARAVESTGISALGIHTRKVPHRPSMKAQWEALPAVVSSLSLPVIANGDVFCHSDFDSIRAATGAASAMSARAALWNPTVFRPEGQQDWHVVKRLFLRQCIQWDNDYKWSKHVIREMIIHHANYEIGEGRDVNRCQTLAQLSDYYGLSEFYQQTLRARAERAQQGAAEH
ncbi:hypothetical protein CLOM_g6546 [Closterium sp. NIES-68]|nr:hypothetical protein CLOM_g6546 [Closterium sp. NIES-68]GJP75694.1 hypothetical protein CLOP_g6110 [Closterium sp. NIES-67]